MERKKTLKKVAKKRPPGQNKRKLSMERLTLRPKETLALTGLSVKATYELLHAGKMPAIKVGDKYLIPKQALIEWINSCGLAHVNAETAA